MIEEWNYSAENLLYHFCSVLRGGMGFRAAQDRMQDLKEREGLDDGALRYIVGVLELLPTIRECSRTDSGGECIIDMYRRVPAATKGRVTVGA
jgi:hypothetical protein